MSLEQISFNLGAIEDSMAGGKNYASGVTYNVYNENDTLASIFSDSDGLLPILQNGIANKSDSDGECLFYIASGSYYFTVEGKKRYFKTISSGSGSKSFLTVDEMIASDTDWSNTSSVNTVFNNEISKAGGATYRINTLAQERIDRDDPLWEPDGEVSQPITYKGTTYFGGVTVGADHYVGGGTEYVAILTHDGSVFDAQFGAIGAIVDKYDDYLALSKFITYFRHNRAGGITGGFEPIFSAGMTYYISDTLELRDYRTSTSFRTLTFRPIMPMRVLNLEYIAAEMGDIFIRHDHLDPEDVLEGGHIAVEFSGDAPVAIASESVAFKLSRVLCYNAFRGFGLDSSGPQGGLLWQFIIENCQAWDSLDYGFWINSLNQTSTTGKFSGCHTKSVNNAQIQHSGKVLNALQHMRSSEPVEPFVTVGWENFWKVVESSNGVDLTPTTQAPWESGTFYRTNGKGYYINNVGTTVITNCSADGGNNFEAGNIINSLNNAVVLDTFHYEGGNLHFADRPPFLINSSLHIQSLTMYDLRLQLQNPEDRCPLFGGDGVPRGRVAIIDEIVNQAQNLVRKGAFDILRCSRGDDVDFNAVKAGIGVTPELFTDTDKIAHFWSDRTVVDYRKPDVEFTMTSPTSHYKIYEAFVPDVGEPVATFQEFSDVIEVSVNSGNDPAAKGKSAIVRVSVFVQSGPLTPDKAYFDVEQISGDGDFIYHTFNPTTRLLEVFTKGRVSGQLAMIKFHGRNSGFGGGETPYKFGSTSRLLAEPEVIDDAVVEAMDGYDSAPLGRQAVKSVVSPHTLTNGDSGYWLYFDSASDGEIVIPNGLNKGVSVLATNLGTGTVTYSITAGEVGRGATELGDPDAFLSLTKLTSIIWQCSERA